MITGGSLRGETVDGHSEQADSRLWHYALRVYAKPAVAEVCLQAQDVYGIDVNLLLFAAWCAESGYRLDASRLAELDEHCRAWREQVITPLRRLRRVWRQDTQRADDYVSIKHLELEAEREQLARLETALGALPAQRGDAALLRANLALVCEYFDAGRRVAESLAAALEADAQSSGEQSP